MTRFAGGAPPSQQGAARIARSADILPRPVPDEENGVSRHTQAGDQPAEDPPIRLAAAQFAGDDDARHLALRAEQPDCVAFTRRTSADDAEREAGLLQGFRHVLCLGCKDDTPTPDSVAVRNRRRGAS